VLEYLSTFPIRSIR